MLCDGHVAEERVLAAVDCLGESRGFVRIFLRFLRGKCSTGCIKEPCGAWSIWACQWRKLSAKS